MITVQMTKKRETKGTWLYEETDNDGDVNVEVALGQLYVKKAAVEALGSPESISISINGD